MSKKKIEIPEVLRKAVYATWQNIGYDVIQASVEYDGKEPDNYTCVECACDAGRLNDYPANSPEAQKALDELVKEHGWVPVQKALAKVCHLN